MWPLILASCDAVLYVRYVIVESMDMSSAGGGLALLAGFNGRQEVRSSAVHGGVSVPHAWIRGSLAWRCFEVTVWKDKSVVFDWSVVGARDSRSWL